MTGQPEDMPPERPGLRLGFLVNTVAALLSIGLVVGAGVWAYRLVMRDVTGVPVVQAMQGATRIEPESAGGEVADNIGLTVNSVLAEGGAAPPEDTLVLAPPQPQLTEEDLEVQPQAEAGEMPAPGAATPATDVAPETDDAPEAEVAEAEAAETEAAEAEAATGPAEPEVAEAPLTAEQILELADQIADAAAPLEPLSEGNDAPPEVSVTGADSSAEGLTRIPASVPGISRSLRPQLRPEAPAAAAAAAEAASPAPQAGAPVEVTTAAIPVGTSLVQLGAFESAEIAASEWDRISGRFGDYMADKERIIQQAESGGRRFFRLRALGFADISDARRFCAALEAEGAECIPVMVR